MIAAIEVSEAGDTIALAGDIELTEAWTPMGTEKAPFCATFDGNGYTISGLTVSEGNWAALFGATKDATIKNVKFEDVDVTGTYAAAAVGYAKATTIENVEVLSGSINATTWGAAGIGAWVVDSSTVNGCTNRADVTGANRAAGICGNFAGTMTKCINEGAVVSNGNMPAGGMVAVASGVIIFENCTNNGNVTNNGTSAYNSNAAGILGHTPSSKVTITSCVNNGAVTADNSYAAGIAISQYGGITATGCSNTGAISGAKSADETVAAKGMFGGKNTVQ